MEEYKSRMINEYYELKERYNKLHQLCVKYDANKLDFELNCPISLLKEQKGIMGTYLYILEVRAKIENINLEREEK